MMAALNEIFCPGQVSGHPVDHVVRVLDRVNESVLRQLSHPVQPGRNQAAHMDLRSARGGQVQQQPPGEFRPHQLRHRPGQLGRRLIDLPSENNLRLAFHASQFLHLPSGNGAGTPAHRHPTRSRQFSTNDRALL
jgi:hypothetical protein